VDRIMSSAHHDECRAVNRIVSAPYHDERRTALTS
jgi:hypothetical protein